MLRIVMPRTGRAAVVAATLALAVAAVGLAVAPAQAGTARLARPATVTSAGFRLPTGVKHACAQSSSPGVASCSALISAAKPAGDPAGTGALPAAAAAPVGYSPANLQSAYGLQSSSAGMRQTVAIVVAYDDPSAEADLGVYRAQYGLPPCTTGNGCFRKVDLASSPVTNPGWAAEASIDMDVVSAVCPQCHILLVEASAADIPDLGSAVDTAVSDGAKFIDNSYYTPETAAEAGSTGYDQYYDHPGVALTASAGDGGYGVSYPAASPYVTAVGGTVLTPDSSVARGWAETAWPGTGSGCSAYEPKPAWQGSTGCSGRLDNDVSAVAASASSQTPVAYYDSFEAVGWSEAGGTSVSAALVAGVYALAGTPASGSNPASYPYSYPGTLNPVTSGSNGTCSVTLWCTAGSGYNGPAGNGTPGAVVAFTASGSLTGAIYNGTTGKCMDNAGNGTTNGNKVEIWTCLGDAAQHWTVRSDGRIETNGMCLGVQGGASAPAGSNVWVWNCGSGGETWTPNYEQRLQPGRRAGICLGINNAGDGANGTQLWINTCDSDAAQQWTLPYPVPTSTGAIQPQASSAVCIGRNDSSSINAATLYGCDGGTGQTWTIESNGTIQAVSECLDVHDSGTANGTAVDYAGCNGQGAQQWRVQADGSLLNPESGKCVAPSGNSATTGTALVLETCSYSTIQEWVLPT